MTPGDSAEEIGVPADWLEHHAPAVAEARPAAKKRAKKPKDDREPVIADTAHETICRHVLATVERGGPLLYTDGQWWQWSEGDGSPRCWRRVGADPLWRAVKALQGAWTGEGKSVRVTASLCSSVERLAQVDRQQDDPWSRSAPGLVTPLGHWFIEGGQWDVRDPAAHDLCRVALAYDPIFGEPSRYWGPMLDRIWSGDADCVTALHEWLGATLAGRAAAHQKAVLLVGRGGEGKSQIMEAIQEMVPHYLRAAVAPEELDTDRFAAADLAGVAANIVAEISDAEIVSSKRIKQAITGEPMRAQRKNGQPFSMRCRCGHLFSANKLPPTRDHSEGWSRRWIVLQCVGGKVAQGERIADYYKLVVEHDSSKVLGAAMAAYSAMLRRPGQGYTIPASSEAALLAWRRDSDSVLDWVEVCCTETEPARGTITTALYKAYCAWAIEAGVYKVRLREFGARLDNLGHGAVRTSRGMARPLIVEVSSG